MAPKALSDKMVTLAAIWEAYAQLIRRRNDSFSQQKLQQRHHVLDKFLGLFIMVSLENKGNSCIGEMRNIGNELSQEFMRNVDAVTRNLSEGEATSSLEDYMLRGRGWRLLYTVDRVGVHSVSQRHDLCEVLINLLPYCLHMKPSSSTEGINHCFGGAENDLPKESSLQRLRECLSDTYNSTQPLTSCFHLVNKSNKLKQLGCPSLQTRKMRREESSQAPMNPLKKDRRQGKSKDRKSKRRFTRSTPSKKSQLVKYSDTEEEEEPVNISDDYETQKMDDQKSKQPRFKRGMRAHMWSVFTKDEDSETDDEFVGSVIGIEDMDMSITAYHLVQILLKLLLSLGELDMNQNVRGRTLSATILPSILYLMSQFRTGSSHVTEVNSEHKGVNSHSIQDESLTFGNTPGREASKFPRSSEPEETLSDGGEDIEEVPWQGHQKIHLLKQVVRTVLTLSTIVATQQNGVRILMHLKVVDHLLDLKILDSLISDGHGQDATAATTSSRSVNELFSLETTVAMDMVCGLMQLLQATYTCLPFNPSNINDANLLTIKLTKPDIISRINRLIEYTEWRTHQFDRTQLSSENVELDFMLSAQGHRVSAYIYESSEKMDISSPQMPVAYDDEKETTCCSDDIQEPPILSNGNLKTCSDDSETDRLNYLENQNKNDGFLESEHFKSLENQYPEDSQLKNEHFNMQANHSREDSKTPSLPSDHVGQNHSSTYSFKDLHKARIIDGSTVSYMHDQTADPIRCIGALITTLKGVKVNYIHSMKCLKRRHRNCEYGMYFDHHHDILGVPHYSSTKTSQLYNNDADYEQSHSTSQGRAQSTKFSPECQSAPLVCVVSELSTILLDYISEARFKPSRIHLMSTLRSVGVCCCLQPEAIISAIVPQLPVFSQAVRSYALDTLISILLDHFQGAQESREAPKVQPGPTTNTGHKSKSGDHVTFSQDTSRCVHCHLEGSSPLLAGLPTTMDSGFSSCDIEEMRKQKLLERWKSLGLLQKIMVSRDEGLALTCAKHLMTLAIRGNSEIKEELFFGVYLRILFMKVHMPRRYSVFSRRSSLGGSLLEKMKTINKDDVILNKDLLPDHHLFGSSTTRHIPGTTSLLNSQESLNDSLLTSGSLTSTEISSADDSSFVSSVPSSIMILCVSALPYVLQVDKVMSIFLARKGLANLTNLLEYEQLRAPVMSVFEALVMIDERRLRVAGSDHRSVYEGGGVIQTFIDTLAKRTCTVTATLQQISLQNFKDKKTRRSPAALADEEFLKIFKVSIGKETGGSRVSGSSVRFHDPEDKMPPSNAKSQESDADEPAPGSMVETLPVLLDMWKTCAKLCMNSRMFRTYYRESPCLYVVQETLVLALSLLGELSDARRNSADSTGYLAGSSSSTSGTVPGPSSTIPAPSTTIPAPSTTIPAPSTTSESAGGGGGSSGGSVHFARSVSIDSTRVNLAHSNDATASDSLDEEDDEPSILFSHEAKLEFIEAVMVVCFSCHTISPSQERGHEDELWLRLNSALKSCIHLEASKLSAVFQMLLNVGLPRCPSILEYSYSQIVSMLNLREREDIADEDEVRKLIQHGFEEDGDAIFTEHGYEGDTECSVCFDWKTGLEYSLENQSMAPSGSMSWPCFPAVFHLFVELMVACHRIASRGVILHTVALRLLQTLRSSRRAVRAFCSEHLLEVLMDGFRDVLVHFPSNGKQSTLQEIIQSVVQVVAQSEISASELRQFLRMFQDNIETSNSLLSTLLAIIEKSKISPNYYATFPVKTQVPSEASTNTLEMSGSGQNILTEQAVWQHTAVKLDVPGITWPPNPTGFTVALWMCMDDYLILGRKDRDKMSGKDRGSKPRSGAEDFDKVFAVGHRLPVTECLLVFAIGNKEKMFEAWAHPKTSSLYCRLTTNSQDNGILKDCIFPHLLTPDTWHLLTITYSETLDGSTFMGKVRIILDGWQKHSAILDHPASMRRRKQLQYPLLCVGDARPGAANAKFHTGTWKMGTLRLFRDVNLSDDWWFHLYCLGPNCEGISKCDSGDLRACYTPAMQKHMANVTNLTWDVLVGVSQLFDMDAARAAQILVYKMSQPELFSVFAAPWVPVDSTHGDLGLVPPSGSVSDLLTQKPVVFPARLRGGVKIREVNTLEKAITQVGGIEAFLYLVAKIFKDSMKAVDTGSSLEMAEHLQSKATHILFQLIHRFPNLTQAFIDGNGYAMMAKVLTSSKSIVGNHLLKVLMDACTTESVFRTSQSGSRLVLLNHPEAIIRDTEILSQLLLQWRIWHKAKDDVTAMLFGALEALCSSKHPHCNFNLKQMQAGNVMNKIFSIYLERIQDGQPSLSVKVSQSASKVIKALLGSPPDLHHLMAVMDFLLLVHPAASGFISFTPSSFYFKLWWDGGRSRASSSSQQKNKGHSKHTISESSVKRQSPSTDRSNITGSKPLSENETAKPSDLQTPLAQSQVAASVGSTIDSQEEEGEVYKYPPLQVTKAGSELNQTTDDAESSSASRSQQSLSVTDSTDKGPSPAYSIQEGTTETNSSSEDSTEEDHDPVVKEKVVKQMLSHNIDGQSMDSRNGPEDTRDKSKEEKQRIMYLSSDVSDKQSDLDDSSITLSGNTAALNEKATSSKSSLQKQSTEGFRDSKSESVGNILTVSQEEEAEQGLTVLCVSLIEYLTKMIQEFPEASLDNVFSKVVNPKSLLVLAKNSSSEMRLAVMKLLGAYMSKAPSNLIDAFIKIDGFYLLANQLRSFPVSTQHVEASVSVLLGQEFSFDENFIVDDLGELSTVQQAAPVLLLSMLDGTASDAGLCRNSLTLLSQLLEANSTMSTLLLDIGLAETMCNLATNIQRRHIRPSPEEEEQTKALLIDVQLVLCSAAVREFGWTGPSHFQNVEDMLALLKALEDHEFNRDSEASKKRAVTARAFQVSLIVKILEYVEKRSAELVVAAHMGWLTTFSAPTSSYNKSHNPISSSQSFSPTSSLSPSSSRTKVEAPSLPPRPLPIANLLVMRRTNFSSPDIMGFLAEATPDDRSATSGQNDSDSSGSSRPLLSPRQEGGNKPSRLGSFFSRKRKIIYASVTQSDLLDRFRKILVTAVDLAVMFPREEQMRPVEERTLNFLKETRAASLEDRYLRHLFLTVYKFYDYSLNKEQSTKKYKNPTMSGAKDVLRIQFTRLLLCVMSLKVHFDLRTFALAFIMTEPRGKEAVKSIITDKQVGTELSFYLYNLLASWRDWLNPTDRENGFALMMILRGAFISIISPDQMLTQAQVNTLLEDKKQIDMKFRKELAVLQQKREVGTIRITNKFEPIRRRVAEQAMTVTQDVTRLQVEERKKLVALIKQTMTKQIQLKKQWQELVKNISHERAVWYQKASYPQSWQLDPTEGPGRVRKRLQRCHLGIEKRFLLPNQHYKLDTEKVDPPLIYLFEDDHHMSDSAALIYRLYTNEKIQHTCKCTVVSPATESKGELLIGEVCIYFVADGAITVANYTQMLIGNLDQLSITWPHTDIRELHKRWYQLQDVGLEIFLISGRTCLLAFQTTHDRDQLYTILRSSLELPNLVAGESLQAVQHAWLEGEVTNYDYLIYLNKLAGRSYTDLMQYPVFPFIIRNYHGNTLDLTHPQEYRNLRKPIAVQDKTREKRYKDNYEFLCQEANRPHSEDEMVRVAPFHYGSHYSNSGTVLYYMVRLPPYTKMFLSYQDSNFDIPDRTFHSLGTSWRLSSFESSTDVKELIPEFFFLPEFFLNNEGFDFGQRQNGERVNHVNLPLWCNNNPRLFVLIHRQALESAIVTRHLHHWLDLVFGFKQQGEEAVKAINVFHPSTYFGVDASGIKDNVKRQALLTMIKTYGQTPKQLFRNPHPPSQVRFPPADVSERQKLYLRKPVPTVSGLKWGQYVGSLDLPPPVSTEIYRAATIKKLVPLPTGLVFGVEKNANILLLHGKQRDLTAKIVNVMWAGVVTWGYHDNIIRIRSYLDKPLINFLPQHSSEKISCVESVPDCRLLFTAGSAGIINVYSVTHNSSKPSNLQVRSMKKTLSGHSGPITTLCVCQEFSILVSGSRDGTCIIWDLNRLTYVRSITSHCAEITSLAVSSTLGDIASVSHLDCISSSLQLHSINAAHVATQEVSDLINCLCYSSAPEGKSVNVVAGGLGSGTIRLWSSWDLTPLKDLVKDSTPLAPVISLTFSSDSQYLVAIASDGSVTLWDKDKSYRRSNAEKFIPIVSSGDGEV